MRPSSYITNEFSELSPGHLATPLSNTTGSQASRARSCLPRLRPAPALRPAVERVPSPTRHASTALPEITRVPLKTRESFRVVAERRREAWIYKDWFHGLATTVSLLAKRAANREEFICAASSYLKLLEAELMRGQVQSAYRFDDAVRLGRAHSPIAHHAYARCSPCGLVEVARRIRLCQFLKTYDVPHILGKFNLGGVPKQVNALLSSRPISEVPILRKEGGRVDMLPEPLSNAGVYIEALGIQIVEESLLNSVAVATTLCRHGLRPSLTECANICAETILQLIFDGNVDGALAVLQYALTGGEAAQEVMDQLARTDLSAAGLMVQKSKVFVDPLMESTPQQIDHLKNAYQACMKAAGIQLDGARTSGADSDMPFYIRQNLQVVHNLIGDVVNFSRPGMPATMCADLTDSLQIALDEIQLKGVSAREQSLSMERFYEAMQDIHRIVRFQHDWAGRQPSVKDAVVSLLLDRPESSSTGLTRQEADGLREHCTVVCASFAMALIEAIRSTLPSNALVACFADSYFETLDIFQREFKCDTVRDQYLPDMNLIFLEPHPSNAALLSLHAHDPVELIDHLFARRPELSRTVVMDVTLNHLADEEISRILKAAKPHIESGRLNLVLLQSATKFVQNGMDLISAGIAVVFNKSESWRSLRFEDNVPGGEIAGIDQGYIAHLLSDKNKEISMAYMDKIRENTAILRQYLESEIPFGHKCPNAFEVCINSDPKAASIAIKLTEGYLKDEYGIDSARDVKSTRENANVQVYLLGFLPAFGDLAAVDRPSFGFNITNFGECGETVRITPGIEEPELLREYADRIIDLGAQLHADNLASSSWAIGTGPIVYPEPGGELAAGGSAPSDWLGQLELTL